MSGAMHPIFGMGPRGLRLWWANQRFEKPGLWISYHTSRGVVQVHILPIAKRKPPKTPVMDFEKAEEAVIGSSPRPGVALSDVMTEKLKRRG